MSETTVPNVVWKRLWRSRLFCWFAPDGLECVFFITHRLEAQKLAVGNCFRHDLATEENACPSCRVHTDFESLSKQNIAGKQVRIHSRYVKYLLQGYLHMAVSAFYRHMEASGADSGFGNGASFGNGPAMGIAKFFRYVVMLNNGVIAWKSRCQPTVALSTMESEYIALADVTKELKWIRTLLAELGYLNGKPDKSTELFSYNMRHVKPITGDFTAYFLNLQGNYLYPLWVKFYSL